MERKFAMWFVGLFQGVMVILFLIFWMFFVGEGKELISPVFWSVFIILFVIIGVIVVSLFFKYIRER